ncbi:MAG: hypothetical protein QM765_16345 [Myxococcales bacterium]
MTWAEAQAKIRRSLEPGSNLGSPGAAQHPVLAVDHPCTRRHYAGDPGLLVQLSERPKDLVELPWSMLKTCFSDLVDGGYGSDTFRRRFPRQAASEPCHVHLIGMVFVVAGLAVTDGRRQATYRAT